MSPTSNVVLTATFSYPWPTETRYVKPTTTLNTDVHTSMHKEETTEDVGNRRVITFGGRGSQLGQFAHLNGVAVSSGNEIFIADHGNCRVQVFNMKGVYVHNFLTTVPGKAGSTIFPYDISIDGNDNLWVVGKVPFGSSYAVQYNRDGRALAKFRVQGSTTSPTIAIDVQSNHILVGKYGWTSCKINIFHPNGLLVRTLNIPDISCEESLVVNREGNIITTKDSMVQVYSQTGHLLFGGHGNGNGRVTYPQDICTDISGHILIADRGSWGVKGWVSMFTSRGNFVRHVVTGLRMVGPIAVGLEGQLVVTDERDNTVTIYTTY
ncbi:tripartite motif-containing protein 3-like [Branchiostoma lanceolatum]|uniref:tripartite motif-containing protein 3-like n=1 Tax=Branchiostoma lanceolatum TaxID=7740 RepID=UPI00345199B8